MKYSSAFGEFFKARRQALGLTLREFCLKYKLDPGNVSRLERGLLPPPRNGNRLGEYAKYLGLKPGSDGWRTFLDLAAKLPLIFRALRGKRFTNKRLDDLVKKIRAH